MVIAATCKLVIISTNTWEIAGLRHLIEQHTRVEVVGEAGSAGSGIQAIKRHNPTAVLIDIDDLGAQTPSFLHDIRMINTKIHIVLLTAVDNNNLVKRAMDQGMTTVVFKIQPTQVLLRELESLADQGDASQSHRQKVVVPSQTSDRALAKERSGGVGIDSLTAREREIIDYLGKGLTNKEIALRLHISFITVRHHLTKIFSKLGIENRQKLLLYAHAHQLVSRPSIPTENPSST